MADKRLQAEDRSHRIGQTNKVLYKDLICKNTVDERVYEVLKRKENLIDFFRGKVLEDILG
jgi:SNF2 family DNA or RNA helicase